MSIILAGSILGAPAGRTAPYTTADDLPGPPSHFETIPSGSLVIPMDNTLQKLFGTDAFNVKAYGLANHLLQNGIPLKWAIAAGKAKNGVDFSATAQRIFPTTTAAAALSFKAGPFIVHKDFAGIARAAITAFNTTYPGNNVAVYELTASATADIRYDLKFKPYIGVSTSNAEIHTDLFDYARIPNYVVVIDTSVLSSSCYTIYTQPHTKSTAGIPGVKAYVLAGGNLLCECLALATYENASTGRFQTTNGITISNVNTAFTYPNPDLAYSQFEGVLNPDPGGSEMDWKLAAGSSWANNGHVHLNNSGADTDKFAATVSKLYNGQGGLVFYLGGHDYGKGGNDITLVNGQRMILNSIFHPTVKFAACNQDFSAAIKVISGTIYEDVNGDSVLGDAVARPNVSVRIYADANNNGVVDTGDTYLSDTTTDASGAYSFSVSTDISGNNFLVVVNSKTVAPSAGLRGGYTQGDVWAEETYGDDPSTAALDLGARFGGRSGTVSDNYNAASTTPANNTYEHVARINASSGDVTGVNFAFSFNAVTSVRGGDTADDDTASNRTVQGSLRQFIQNANAVNGANAMRFTPAVATNASGGGGNWWNITLSSALPSIVDTQTTIDGTAYSSTDGTTVRDDNAGSLGVGGTVGVDALALPQVARPEFSITDSGVNLPQGLDVQASSATIRALAIYGFGNNRGSGVGEANIRVTNGAAGTLIEQNVIGSSAGSFTDPGATRTDGDNITLLGAATGTIIRNNLIGFASYMGVLIYTNATNTTVEGNEIRGNGIGHGNQDGISTEGNAGTTTARGNLIIGGDGTGVDMPNSLGSNTVVNNTITGNGVGTDVTTETAGVRVWAAGNVVDRNIINANYGPGVMVTSAAAANTITRNSIFDNGTITNKGGGAATGQIGIDLLTASDDVKLGTAPFVTINDDGDVDAGGNELLNFPVITSANIVGSNLVLTGFARPGSVMEIFISDGDPKNFGEGKTYLATLTEGSGADTDSGTGTYNNPVNGLNQGTDTTNKFSFTIPAPGGVSAGTKLTATATLANATSEFSGVVTVAVTSAISGKVFEDVNYGGGAGRDFTTAAGVGRQDTRVELYDASGNFVTSTTTDASGAYSFSGVPLGNSTIRVVNNTVTSSRTGYVAGLLPVQTFRTSGLTGTSGTADPNRVGGENPAVTDAGSGNTGTIMNTATGAFTAGITGQAQSITTVNLGASAITGIDFGFNFDTIVNTNDTGQGSLRQFILNSNALSNTGLAQAGQTAGTEVSIFMISDGGAHAGLRAGLANQLTGGVARIQIVASLPVIAGADGANTVVDGGTQTTNVGDTNAGQIGSGGTVGVGATALPLFNKPEVEIDGSNTQILSSTADGTVITRLAMYQTTISVSGNSARVEDVLIGLQADGSQPASTVIGGIGGGVAVNGTGTNTVLRHNYVRLDGSGFRINGTGAGLIIEYNEIDLAAAGQSTTYDGIVLIGSTTNPTLRYNLVKNMRGAGMEIGFGATLNNALITENTVQHNGYDGAAASTEPMGICVFDLGGGAVTLQRNVVTANSGPGIVVVGSQNVLISDNSTYLNGGLGIDLDPVGTDANNYTPQGVTINDLNDADTGPNGLLNFPVITSANIIGGNLVLSGFARPGSVIEFFVSDGDPGGFGEGQTYVTTFTEGSGADTDAGTGTYTNPVNGLNQGTDTTNKFTFTIPLPGGVSAGTKLTATATLAGATSEFSGVATVAATTSISGNVFEDVNYGGGAGRTKASSSGVNRPGAVVELYDNTGNFITSTTTDASGNYTFSGLPAGNYTFRVVNSTVTSSRTGYVAGLLPVQTFRTNGLTGTVGTADPNRVGGEDPTQADAGTGSAGTVMNTTTGVFTAGISGQAQSITTVTLGASAITGIDFGFNFDTIVNTNDTGQGSLRQFITNANALSNAGLAQSGQPGGQEVSIFMIPDGASHAGLRAGLTNQLNASGVAVITLASLLPTISDASTTLEGTTQTTNVGDTNAGTLGVGGTVGVDALALSAVNRPEVQLVDGAANLSVGLVINANSTTLRGFAIYGFGNLQFNNGHETIRVDGGTGILIENNVIGASATSFADPGAARSAGENLWVFGGTGTVRNNLIGYAGTTGMELAAAVTGWTVQNNEFRGNSAASTFCEHLIVSSSGNTITGNLFADSRGSGIELINSTAANLVRNNTFTNNGLSNPSNETAAILIGGTGGLIEKNIINANFGPGVLVKSTASGITISMNSIFANGTTLNESGSGPSGQIGIDLTSAADSQSRGTAPFVTINDNGDGDAGANGLLNFPVLDTAIISGANLVLTGYARPASVIEFFIADPDPSGFGEGKTYLVTLTEGSAADGDNTTGTYTNPVNGLNQGTDTTNKFSFTIPIPGGVANGTKLTATATVASATSEFSGIVTVAQPGGIGGTVFEDVNYGGGAGRDSTVSGASPRSGARVELYDGAGAFVSSTVTDASGNYTFAPASIGTYTVRVVNNTVSSSRAGYVAGLLPVQTFRTNGASGGVGTPDLNRVGGEDPSAVDAGNGGAGTIMNTATGVFTAGIAGQAQSIATVSTGASAVTGIDFGFNFDTVVNVNNTGQGSLRQFIDNANALANAGLTQTGLVAGKDNAVFMISNGTAASGLRATNNYFVGGVATIDPLSALPTVTDPVVLDATIQPGFVSAPIVQLNGTGAGAGANGFNITAGSSTVKGFVINRFNGSGIVLSTGGSNTIQNNYLGTDAAGAAASQNNQQGLYINGAANNIIGGAAAGEGNVISGNSQIGIYLVSAGASGNVIQGNKIGVDATGTGILGNGTQGIDAILGASNNTIGGTAAGAANIIAGNGAKGIRIFAGTGNKIQRNSIYGNTSVGIDLGNDAVTPNDGAVGGSANNGMDYPVFTTSVLDGATLNVSGYVGNAPGQATFANATIEIFKADNTPADQNGQVIAGDGLSVAHGEGRTYLGTLTADANGNFSGTLPGGSLAVGDFITATAMDAADNTSEFSANAVLGSPAAISGTVFEDVNYGGGSGRSLAASSGVVRQGARVELYDGSGNFVGSTTTDAAGAYSFASVTPGNYNVRVVNNTVTSSRTGYVAGLLPVQTFRTNASTGTAVAVTDRVGGENPGLVDAGNGSTTLAALNTATTTAQSIAPVAMGGAAISGVDFGFNFDTVVNTNDTGQGSLRQFTTNANALSNTGLAQFGLTAGIEHAIFMISNGTAAPGLRAANNYFSGGIATISLASPFATIAEAVVIDGSIQPGFTTAPIIQLNGSGAGGGANGLSISAGGSTVKSLVIDGFGGSGIVLSGSGGNTIAGNYIGTSADGGSALANGIGVSITGGNGNTIGGTSTAARNVISGNTGSGIVIGGGVSGTIVQDNYVGTNASGTVAVPNGTGISISGGNGNTIGGTGIGEPNLIFGNAGNGVTVSSGVNNTISGNAIYQNGAIGIDLGNDSVTLNDNGDGDSGANMLLNFPVIETITLAGGNMIVSGYARPGAVIEFFEADVDPTNFGEGSRYLVSFTEGAAQDLDATSGTYGNPLNGLNQGTDNTNRFRFSFPIPPGIGIGSHITATATDPGGNTSEFSGIASVPTTSQVITGTVYRDANHNALKDASETGTGLTLYAKIFLSSSPAGPAFQALSVDPVTGDYSITGIPAGTYIVVIDDNASLADVTPTIPPGWIGTEQGDMKRTIVAVAGTTVSNQNFGLYLGSTISGTVFADTGAGGGTGNDGIKNGAEPGIAGVTVKLTDATGATTYDTVVTDGGGNYLLYYDGAAGLLKIVETNLTEYVSTGAAVGTTGGTYVLAADTVTFNYVTGPSYTGVNFGDVKGIVFTTDGAQAGLPGATVVYPHTFAAGAAGQVTFTTTSTPNPAGTTGWSQVLYLDADCNGKLDAGESVISSPVSVNAGQQICILVKEFIPAGAPLNATNKITVTASFVYSGAPSVPAATATRTDLTTVGNGTTAGLTLVKSVDKTTALPGETITYTITYTNNSTGGLSDVVIYDSTPAFSTYTGIGSGPLPNDLTGVSTAHPNVGEEGPLSWTFTGTLAPGGTGTVTFSVTLTN
jgi:parallel beta-helix repeat protein